MLNFKVGEPLTLTYADLEIYADAVVKYVLTILRRAVLHFGLELWMDENGEWQGKLI